MIQQQLPLSHSENQELKLNTSARYKMILTPHIEYLIRYLCHQLPNVEWSGALFYTYKGSFENNDLVIKCHDLYLMNIGTSGYTEWEVTPELASYMANNPILLTYQLGIVHSHNAFNTFFSGTDTNTLLEQGLNRNNLVSLIVNNAGNYKAAITRKIITNNTIHSIYNIPFFGTKDIQNKEVSTQEQKTIVEYFYLDVEKDLNYDIACLQERIDKLKPASNSVTKQDTNLFTTIDETDENLFDEINNLESIPDISFESSSYDDIGIPDEILDKYIIRLLYYKKDKNQKIKAGTTVDSLIYNMNAIYSHAFGDRPLGALSFGAWLTNQLYDLQSAVSNDFGNEYGSILQAIHKKLRTYIYLYSQYDNVWLTDIVDDLKDFIDNE